MAVIKILLARAKLYFMTVVHSHRKNPRQCESENVDDVLV